MKFLQIHTFYDLYLQQFYQANPDLHLKSAEEQTQVVLSDGFSAMHLFAPYMKAHGYDGELIIANNLPAQIQWAASNGIDRLTDNNWPSEIIMRQLDQKRPEILYLTDPITFDSRFIRALTYRPKLVVGWRAADIPASCDFSEFDLMLSSDSGCLETLKNQGARRVQKFLPGFPEWIGEKVSSEPKSFDLVICGQCSPLHKKRTELLSGIAQKVTSKSRRYALGYFIFGEAPADCAVYNHGAIWGMGMYRALRHGRIAVNSIIDFARERSGNMRQFEATGVGSFLLTEEDNSLTSYFTPGVEIETYNSFDNMIEKIDYYLSHEREREEIAMRGHRRCLTEHSMTNRLRDFNGMIKELL